MESYLSKYDDDYKYEKLLNDLADELTKRGRDVVLSGEFIPSERYIFYGANVGLKIKDCVVANKVMKIGKYWTGRDQMKRYLREKYHWSEGVFERMC